LVVQFARYAAFVLTVDVFFYIAAAADLISAKRVTNKVDLAYLFYLPFCMLFISSDNIHGRCAPLFLREDQQFIRGEELKADLKKLDELYDKLPQEEKEKGLSAYANHPPMERSFLVTRLWDTFLPRWRSIKKSPTPRDKKTDDKLLNKFQKLTKAKTLEPEEVDFDTRNPDSLTLQRKYKKLKGKYWQLPKDLKVDNIS